MQLDRSGIDVDVEQVMEQVLGDFSLDEQLALRRQLSGPVLMSYQYEAWAEDW